MQGSCQAVRRAEAQQTVFFISDTKARFDANVDHVPTKVPVDMLKKHGSPQLESLHIREHFTLS